MMVRLPKAYGLTGGIASGKSTISQFFKDLGVPVVCADEMSREICKKGEPGWKQIKEAFGETFFSPSGELDRHKLGAFVFSKPEKRKQLEAITHPLIMDEVRRRVRQLFDKGNGLVLVEAAVLMEAGFDKEFHGNIVVTCKESQQLERICKRDGLTQEEAQQRISAQWPIQKKIDRATFVIDNSGSLEKAKQQVQEVFEKIKNKKEREMPIWH